MEREKSPNRYTYGGHRRKSMKVMDKAELVELRARQRTFNEGYTRAALLCLGNTILMVKIFDERFYDIGILFALLAGLLMVTAYLRRRHSNRDFSDQLRPLPSPAHASGRVFGAPFTTAGWIVIGVTLIVSTAEIVLIVLISRL
ncbi:hypothetical protein FRB91_007523 [Serendipita sp. 411]|nr:hypothetical protein FRB91_007523 [Serendipita sp. 411]